MYQIPYPYGEKLPIMSIPPKLGVLTLASLNGKLIPGPG